MEVNLEDSAQKRKDEENAKEEEAANEGGDPNQVSNEKVGPAS